MSTPFAAIIQCDKGEIIMNLLKITAALLSLLLVLGACGTERRNAPTALPDNSAQSTSGAPEIVRGAWISYIELGNHDKTESGFKSNVCKMFDNLSGIGITDLFVQVRANADAAYPSKIFPFAAFVSGKQGKDPGFDPLEFMVDYAHSKKMRFHAWINPYRAASSVNSINDLAENNPARLYLTDNDPSNDNLVKTLPSADGKIAVWFNPSSPEIQRLVCNGAREIIDNYNVDGLHIDDYFYPTRDPQFDETEYNAYAASVKSPLSLDDWRRVQVDSLVCSLYRATHSKNNTVFGVSPSAHISKDGSDKNYTEQYADIRHWASCSGYADYIAPQLYFGYDYPTEKFRFSSLLNDWTDLKRHPSVALYIGLAAYKLGSEDAESPEWQTTPDILKKQAADAETRADGVIIYSYSGLFKEDSINKQNLAELQKYFSAAAT